MLHHLRLRLFRCSITASNVEKLGHKDMPCTGVGNLSALGSSGGQNSSGLCHTGEEFILSAALSLTGFLL